MHPGRRPSNHHRIRLHGFTLIELLVVIAIIAVLVSILVPSLKRAKELASAVGCLANLRSIGTAMQLYLSESDNNIFPLVSSATETVAAPPYSRWRHSGDSPAESEQSTPIYADVLVDRKLAGKELFDCPAHGGEGTYYDKSTSPWTPLGSIEDGCEYPLNWFFIPTEWGGCPNNGFYTIKNLTATDSWPLKYIDFPQDGMIVADQPPSGRYAFVYPWGSSSVHPDDFVNVLYFDGRSDSRAPEDFWPNIRTGGMDWRDSALWRPIEEGVNKTW